MALPALSRPSQTTRDFSTLLHVSVVKQSALERGSPLHAFLRVCGGFASGIITWLIMKLFFVLADQAKQGKAIIFPPPCFPKAVICSSLFLWLVFLQIVPENGQKGASAVAALSPPPMLLFI